MKKGFREPERKEKFIMTIGGKKEKIRIVERECECSLEIRDSIVVILCGDEFDRITDTISSAIDAKAALDAKVTE